MYIRGTFDQYIQNFESLSTLKSHSYCTLDDRSPCILVYKSASLRSSTTSSKLFSECLNFPSINQKTSTYSHILHIAGNSRNISEPSVHYLSCYIIANGTTLRSSSLSSRGSNGTVMLKCIMHNHFNYPS